jgi:hypothetical protein
VAADDARAGHNPPPMNLPGKPSLSMFGANRREHDRRPLRTQATVLVARQTFLVRTLDVSESGVGILAEVNPAIGTRFRIAFALPNKRAGGFTEIASDVQAMGSIFSSTDGGFRIGARFNDATPAMVAALADYVRG